FSNDICYTSLAAVPTSHVTNLGGLGVIALELALENVTNTVSIISSLSHGYKSHPRCDSCLESCLELYVDMSIILVVSVILCLDKTSFKEEGNKSPSTKENHKLSQLCGIVFCIIDLISPNLKL
ncbi:putative invertase inhibitor, partial [Bienertia sinuspersici]